MLFNYVWIYPKTECKVLCLSLDPSRPQNVTVIADGDRLVVSWLPPNFPNGEMKYYIILWRKNIKKQESTMEEVDSSPFSLENLGKYFVASK